jgi:imidazole glycerol-phosphate synthase subunit HisH
MNRVVIIDNGGANIASLGFALERLNCATQLSSDPQIIRDATHIILPGVGAAADAMTRLRAQSLDQVIPALTQPLLGICLGMQLLYEASEEGNTPCLGAIPGTARRFTAASDRPVPQMGWNTLQPLKSSPLLDGVGDRDYAYFVHSYALPIGPETLAAAEYGGPFSAIVNYKNFYGTQFHPERSSGTGAKILKNFLSLKLP